MTHSKEPWRFERGRIYGNDQPLIFVSSCQLDEYTTYEQYEFEEDADGRRIVECVNACAGIADPSVIPELVEVAETLLGHVIAGKVATFDDPSRVNDIPLVIRSRALLSKIKGE